MCKYNLYACVCMCACDITPLSVSVISHYLGFLVGSVVSIATLLPSVSGEGLLEPLWVLLGRCKSDWECRWQSSTHQDCDGLAVAQQQITG